MEPITLVIPAITIFGAGFSSYLGVRLALTELKGEVRRHDDKLQAHEEKFGEVGSRIDRLERPYFRSGE